LSITGRRDLDLPDRGPGRTGDDQPAVSRPRLASERSGRRAPEPGPKVSSPRDREPATIGRRNRLSRGRRRVGVGRGGIHSEASRMRYGSSPQSSEWILARSSEGSADRWPTHTLAAGSHTADQGQALEPGPIRRSITTSAASTAVRARAARTMATRPGSGVAAAEDQALPGRGPASGPGQPAGSREDHADGQVRPWSRPSIAWTPTTFSTALPAIATTTNPANASDMPSELIAA